MCHLMSVQQDIVAAQQHAMKQRRADELNTLRLLTSAIKNEQIAKGKTLSDEEVIGIVKKQVKQLVDAQKDFVRANRQDLMTQTQKEIEIMSRFLPAQLSDQELQTVVQQILASMSDEEKSHQGKMIGMIMKQVGDRADGSRVRDLLSRLQGSSQ